MKLRHILYALIFVCAGAFLCVYARIHYRAPSAQSGNLIKVGFEAGDIAPDFELRSLDGRNVKLSDLRGKPVLLNFWATWCAPCRVEMPWLVQLDEKYRTHGLQIVGVSMDDPGAAHDVSAFTNQWGVTYQILFGNSSTADAYGGVRFMPQNFFIGANGTVIKTTVGLTDKKGLEEAVRALLTNASGPRVDLKSSYATANYL